MNSSLFALALMDGVSYAALVFLVALGLTLIFGVMNILNIAHGSLYAWGGYVAATFGIAIARYGLPPWLAADYGTLPGVSRVMDYVGRQADPATYQRAGRDVAELQRRYAEVERTLAEQTDRWLLLQEQLEDASTADE